jgi:hypothetical protein
MNNISHFTSNTDNIFNDIQKMKMKIKMKMKMKMSAQIVYFEFNN